MNQRSSLAAKWKICALASLAMVLLSLLPQIHFWLVQGRNWNGAYVSMQGDEPLYSAYINALIEGRHRKNDPFGGKDSTRRSPLGESIYSIQFVPPFVIAILARMFGVSASTAFIVLTAVTAFLASFTLFWLLAWVTDDHRLAASGMFLVLCVGGVGIRYGVFGTFVDIAISALPFLRRYQPATMFPLFLALNLLVWCALTSATRRNSQVASLLAGLSLAVLIFSYLYLWLAAAAWLVCIGVLWLYFRPSDRKKTLAILTLIGSITVAALVPYIYLVTRRAATLDEQQILTLTHRPDLFRTHEILAAAILVALVIGVRRNKIDRVDPRFIYAASLALLPFILFNQQILTGRTMQVFHFEIFVANYSTLIGLVVAVKLLWTPLPRQLLIWMAALSLSWAVIAVGLYERLVFVPAAIANDLRIPVLLQLKALSKHDGTLMDLRNKGETSNLVFSPSVALVALLPTWTSQGTLLDITGVDCGTITRQQRKDFFYMHLYYSRVDVEALRQGLNGTPARSRDELSSVRTVIFGYERTTRVLTSEFDPVRPEEIEREVQVYQAYINSFSREEALKRPLTYAVIPVESNFDFTNLDRWYERDGAERFGSYALYRLKLRS